MDRVRAMRWQQRILPEAMKENLSPAEQQVHPSPLGLKYPKSEARVKGKIRILATGMLLEALNALLSLSDSQNPLPPSTSPF